MPITRKRRAETIAEHTPDHHVKRQSARVKNNNVKYYDEDQAEINSVETTIDKSSDLRDYLNVKRQSNRVKNNNNVLASSQKYCLSDIFYDRCRPSLAQTNSESQKVYIIPRTFVHEWRLFVGNPQSVEPIRDIPNNLLLCEHGGLIYPVDFGTESDKESTVYMISEAEWSQIQSLFAIDTEISVIRTKTNKGEVFSTDPSVCYKCFEERCHEVEKEQLIAKIEAKDKKIKSLEMSNVEAEELVTSNNNKIQDLENLNDDLKNNLEETTEILKNVRSQFRLQNEKLELVSNSMEENKKDCEKVEALQKVVATKNNKIQGLENLNANLMYKLEETTETLNVVKSKLLLQNEVRQRDYKDYEVNLGSKNTAIKKS